MDKYFIIPILIPELEYNYNCILAKKADYGKGGDGLTKEKIAKIIDNNLQNIDKKETFIELELYLSSVIQKNIDEIEEILKVIDQYKKSGKIDKITINSSAKYINKKVIKLLKKYKIKDICIKCMTSNEYLLKNLKFGYEFKDIKKVVKKLRWNSFEVSANIMVGLPESTVRDDIDTAKDLINLKIKKVNINVAVVEKGSNLQTLLEKGEYILPNNVQLTEELKEIMQMFNKKKIIINEIGNHIVEEKNIYQGLYTKKLKKMVESAIWYENIVTRIKNFNVKVKEVEIQINPDDEENVIGYEKENLNKLKNVYDVDLVIKKNQKIGKGKSKMTILKTYTDFIEEN